MEEAQQADKRAREVISDLCNLHQWTLDNAIYEVSEVRSELSALLAPRPAMPKPPPQPHLNTPFRARGRQGKGRSGKDRSTSGKGQGNKSSAIPGGKWLSALYEVVRKRPSVCDSRLRKGAMTKYLHVCGVPRSEGRACWG